MTDTKKPDDIEKLVRDWYYTPRRIGGPDNLAVLAREIVAAQTALLVTRAEAAEALVEELRTGLQELLNANHLIREIDVPFLTATNGIDETRRDAWERQLVSAAKSVVEREVAAEALLDRSRKGNGA